MLRSQEPAGKSLRGVVHTVAGCHLAQAVNLYLNEFKDTAMNVFILLKGLLEMVQRNAHRCPRQLHTAMCRDIGWTDKVQAANEAFTA